MKPLYFYHLVNKDANLSLGLLSLKYLYDNQEYQLFDKYSSKYRERITNSWQIPKYQNRQPNSLTREEIIDGLTIYRGKYGPSYIYFFRYPPTKDLGPHMSAILANKDIYRLDLNNPQIQPLIKDIFYGYQNSHSDNFLLTKEYYEQVSKETYFQNYDDNSKMNYASLNHIAIAFQNNYCPIEYLTKERG